MKKYAVYLMLIVLVSFASAGGCNNNSNQAQPLPEEILSIMNQPRYGESEWSLRVTDLDTGELIYNLEPNLVLLTGSLRKTFSSGSALNELGVNKRFKTPVYRQGEVGEGGVLAGDLILIASGDLTFGGRSLPGDKIQFTTYDHVDANPLGGAVLTPQDPLRGLNELAAQVAESGIKKITGDIAVDARLFDEFVVPNNKRLVSPMIVNENLIDVTITPTEVGEPAIVTWRPESAAFDVQADILTVASDEELDIQMSDPDAACFESDECSGVIEGVVPKGYMPSLPELETLVKTFKIQNPSAYARTAFIEALEKQGVSVEANLTGPNPVNILPPENSYNAQNLVSEFTSPPFSEATKLILKVSHNYGSNLSLILFGLAKGVRTVEDSLLEERATLTGLYNVPGEGFNFPTNGSGSPDSEASARAVTTLLDSMSRTRVFDEYFDSFPILGVDGSLKFVDEGSAATGKVRGKTGTSVGFDPDTEQLLLKAKSLGGYIDSKSGRQLIFAVFVNNTKIDGIPDVVEINDDLGKIAGVIYDLN